MSSANTPGGPRAGRDRRIPARAHTFKHGTVDPVTSHRRPLLTIGNLILLLIILGFGLYATGNLHQLDAFFDQVNSYGRAHNNLVVSTLITYGAILFGILVLAIVVWMIFLFINADRRSKSDPKGWHKTANDPPIRHKSERRNGVRRPSVILPFGKERPANNPAINPAPTTPQNIPVAAKAEALTSPIPAASPKTYTAEVASPAPVSAASPQPHTAKEEAIAAAAKAEATLARSPDDLPSFIRPLGKYLKQNAQIPAPSTSPAPIAAKATPQTTTAAQVATPTTAATKTTPSPTAVVAKATPPAADTSFLAFNAATAKAEAAIAAAKALAAQAEAAMAAAMAEATIAAAKAELAATEAAIAAAKAQSFSN